MSCPLIIDYENLVQTYLERLNTILRSFTPAAGLEFIVTWVPDDDHLASILSLLELARDEGPNEVIVHIGPSTLKWLDLPKLESQVKGFATVQTRPRDDGLDFEAHFVEAKPPARGAATKGKSYGKLPQKPIKKAKGRQGGEGGAKSPRAQTKVADGVAHPAYKAGILAALKDRSHEEDITVDAGQVLVQHSCEGMTLMAAVDPGKHLVTKVRYQGASTDVQRGLLERLAAIMEGKPLLECSDHAVIYLEHAVRDQSQPRPVPGIVMPSNADPAFEIPLKLVRGLVDEYREKMDYREDENFYAAPASPWWRALSKEAKIQRVQAMIDGHPAGHGLKVVRVEGQQRVIVDFEDDPDYTSQPGRLMKVETHLKYSLEGTIQLHTESRVDQNKLRRLTEVRT